MALHIVLDHSALIPCGDKPQEEKAAIRKIGELLPEVDVVRHTSRSYLKTLHAVLSRQLKQHHPLPRLHSILVRNLRNILQLSNNKTWWCQPRTLAEHAKMKIHVVARSALEHVNQELLNSLETSKGLSREDLEVVALAVASTRYASPIHLVTTDGQLLQMATQLAQSRGLEVKVLTPRQIITSLDKT